MRQVARDAMDHYGLKAWKFTFDGPKNRFGQCDPKIKTISMSRHLVSINDPKACMDTLLHEIAHALTPGAGHGKKWKAKARELGCTPKATYTSATVEIVPHPWIGHCPKCSKVLGKAYRRHQNPRWCFNSCSGHYGPMKWVPNPLAG